MTGGCCSPKPGVHTCPTDEPDHVNNEYYEMYRVKCDSDNCNIMDPRTYSGGDSNNDGGIVVHGNGAAEHFKLATILATILAIVAMLL